jgi:hypothetical protein
MSAKLLYYGSLEKHMNAYMKQVKQTEFNQQLQLAQNKIVREGELMNLSQADIMNKLKQLQEELKQQITPSLIPLSKTNAPERLLNPSFKKPTIKTRSPSVSLEEIENKKASLRKTPSPEHKEKKLSPFQQQLNEKLKTRSQSNSPISTDSTSASTSSPTASTDTLGKQHFNAEKGKVKKLMKKHDLDFDLTKYKSIADLNELQSKIIEKHGSGLKKGRKIGR